MKGHSKSIASYFILLKQHKWLNLHTNNPFFFFWSCYKWQSGQIVCDMKVYMKHSWNNFSMQKQLHLLTFIKACEIFILIVLSRCGVFQLSPVVANERWTTQTFSWLSSLACRLYILLAKNTHRWQLCEKIAYLLLCSLYQF